jgi:hypothetical protein
MAGEWIKMRTNLWDDPRVSQICDMTGAQEAAVIGALYWLWASADEHTEDGFMPGLSKAAIDRKTGLKGFGDALISVRWIESSDDGITISHFSEHNGSSAKKRCQTAKRVANHTAANAQLTQENNETNAESVSDALAIEEKRREEKNIKPLKSKAEATNGSRLPTDWTPSAEDIDFCKKTRPDLVASQVSERFKDYWIAATGKGATKRDWSATWRNWVRNEKSTPAVRASPAYQTAADRAKQWADIATGKAKNESHRTIIDIN